MLASAASRRPIAQEALLAAVAAQLGGPFEFGGRFAAAAELHQQGWHARWAASDSGPDSGPRSAARSAPARLPDHRPSRPPPPGSAPPPATGSGPAVRRRAPRFAASRYRPRRRPARGRRQSRPAACTCRAPGAALRRGPAPPARAGSAGGPSDRDPDRAAGSACHRPRCGHAAARPGFPSAPPGRALRPRPLPARRESGRAAALPRTAPGASSRRQRWPRALR